MDAQKLPSFFALFCLQHHTASSAVRRCHISFIAPLAERRFLITLVGSYAQLKNVVLTTCSILLLAQQFCDISSIVS